MSKSKIYIEKNNYHRVIVTDLLPYETPLIFSNDGYYKYLDGQYTDIHNWVESNILKTYKNDTLPFSYKIKKNYNSYRTLSIIHPKKQEEFVEFYEKYDFLMISLCNKSSFSLRKPTKVIGQYFDDPFVYDGDYIKASSNYFQYDKYTHMYKFFNSYEFHRLEKRFNYLMSLDISKCFYNIYTHSICWAVKSKDYAKDNAAKNINSFENDFDTLMQKSNYNETNGILVGPEISRVFAEIIFQKIDLNIENKLFNKRLLHKRDYDIKRYIDDYFIFVNDKDNFNIIKKVIEEELEYYKLYLNDSKTSISETPFMTNITMAKMSTSDIINKYFELFILVDDNNSYELNKIVKYYKQSHKMIEDIKKELKVFSLKYNEINNFILKVLSKKIKKFTKNYEYSNENRESLFSFFKFILDVVFFIYPMDVRVNTTYNISNIIVDINECIKKTDNEIIFGIRKKIVDESFFVINKICEREKSPTIEVLNLLIVLGEVARNDLTIDEKEFQKRLHLNTETDLNYFQIISLLFFCKDDPSYKETRKLISLQVKEKLKDNNFKSTEKFLLFFDVLSCPFYENNEKKKMLNNSISDKIGIIDSIKKYRWFTNWYDLDMKRLLYKKELRVPYER